MTAADPHAAAEARSRPAPPEPDIDTRIRLVEQRLLARQARLLGRSRVVARRLRRRVGPPALLAAGLGTVLAGAGLRWLMRRGPSTPSPADADTPRGQQLPGLASLLPMLWPWLPARWRTRVSPATVVTVLSLAGPVLERLLPHGGSRPSARPVAVAVAVARLDPGRFAGTWHEQARLPERHERRCAGVPRAHYTPRPGGLEVRNECEAADGKLQVAEGVARAAPRAAARGGELEVTFAPPAWRWLPFVWADFWVLAVDEAAADYRVALVGQPSRRGLWVLSRSPQLPEPELQQLLQQARAMGFDTDRLIRSGAPATSRRP